MVPLLKSLKSINILIIQIVLIGLILMIFVFNDSLVFVYHVWLLVIFIYIQIAFPL